MSVAGWVFGVMAGLLGAFAAPSLHRIGTALRAYARAWRVRHRVIVAAQRAERERRP